MVKRSPEPAVRRAKPLTRDFFARAAEAVARELIGTLLVRRWRGRDVRARIVETEAYVGPHDLACHASRGRTARTEVMFGPAGHAYVYLVYGIHDMFNIVTGPDGDAQAVLIRAAEPLDGLTLNLCGPGNLARNLKITRALNGADLTSGEALYVLPARRRERRATTRVAVTTRVGVDYAGTWKDARLRFYDPDSSAVSRRPKAAAGGPGGAG